MPASLSVETFSLATRQRVSGPDDISLPSETSHRDVAVHDEVFFASGRSGRWYAQTKNGNRRLWLSRSRPHFLAGSGMLLPVQACVRLLAGVVLELRAQSSIGEPEWSVVLWRAVLTERPAAALVQSSGPSPFDALGNDELGAIIGQLGGHSTSTYALAATCRAGRAAVQRWLAPLIDKTQRERSLWQLVGERWPLAVLHAKLDASPKDCEQQLVEMLSSGLSASMGRLSGFPFAAHITKGWELPRVASGPPQFVPAGLLLEKASPDALASLCVRIPAAAVGLEKIAEELSRAVERQKVAPSTSWRCSPADVEDPAAAARQTAERELRAVREVQQALRRLLA